MHAKLSALLAIATLCSACFDLTRQPYGRNGEPCYAEGTCNDELFCDASFRCIDPCTSTDCNGHGSCTPVKGEARCACDEGYITSGTGCIGPGQLGNPCLEDLTCEGDLFCDGSHTCVACATTEDVECTAANIYSIDSCGRRQVVYENCGGHGCVSETNVCVPPRWLEEDVFHDLAPYSSGYDVQYFGDPVIAISTAQSSDGQHDIYIWRYDGDVHELTPGSASNGGVSATAGDSTYPTIARDAAENVYVGWLEETANGDFLPAFKILSAGTWSAITCEGAVAASAGRTLVAASGDEVYFSWAGFEGKSRVWRVDGMLCTAVSEPSSGWDDTYYIRSLVVSTDGIVQLAGSRLAVDDEPDRVFVSRLVDDTWATSLFANDNFALTTNVSMAVDIDGDPVLAILDYGFGAGDVFAFAYKNGAWSQLGGNISNTASESAWPAISINNTNSPIVAWEERDAQRKIHLRRWDGRNWVPYGYTDPDLTAVTDEEDADGRIPELATVPGAACVVWHSGLAWRGPTMRCTY